MTGTQKRVSVALLVVAAFLGGVVFVTSAMNLTGLAGLFQGADAQRALDDVEAIATAENLGEAFTAVAERVNPAVVQIRTTRTADPAASRGQFDPFGGLFDPRGGAPQTGLGSGAFVTGSGYIVTNNHVVEDADEPIEVLLFDGRTVDAAIVGTDPFSDLAVLEVEGDGYPAIPFGDSDELRVGQWVLAFGSPLSADLSNTVTSGIISSLGRYSGSRDPRGRPTISNYIQTDAAVNPGNSGGPLVNLRGEIVGINSAIATRTGTFNGISFAIPADIVRSTVEQLIDSGVVERGYLGIQFRGAPASLRRAFGAGPGAATIEDIAEDAEGESPAADAGLREGDLITALDGVELTNPNQIISIISTKRPGDTVEVTYNRDGRERTAEVTLGRRPGDAVAQGAPRPAPRSNGVEEPTSMDMLGLTLRDLTAREARQFDGAAGVLVADVDRASDAYREAEIDRGYLIVEADREPVGSVREFREAIADVEEGETFLVRVRPPGTDVTFLTALRKG
jgi:serine protease Do